MVQKESQAALEERESERSANPAAPSGPSLEPPAAPAPGEDNASGAGAAAGAGAPGGTRRFLCGVVEGESALQPRPVPSTWSPGRGMLVGLRGVSTPTPQVAGLPLLTRVWGRRGEAEEGLTSFPPVLSVPSSWLLRSLTPPSLGLEPGRPWRRRRGQGACCRLCVSLLCTLGS